MTLESWPKLISVLLQISCSYSESVCYTLCVCNVIDTLFVNGSAEEVGADGSQTLCLLLQSRAVINEPSPKIKPSFISPVSLHSSLSELKS